MTLLSVRCAAAVVLEFVRRDTLAAIIPALPIPGRSDLKALPVGRREDGLPWLVKLHGTHVLIAGATGAGKASLLWGLIRAMFPLMRTGLVRVLAADPKWMELAYGRVIFDTYGAYAADPAAIVAMLEAAVADMQARAAVFAGVQRDHAPTREHPFTVVLVDEVAFLTAYQPDRKLRERVMNALATLTTQGRAVKTYERYEAFTRLHIVPYLGSKRLDKRHVRDLRQWLNKPAQVCQCCAQGNDAARPLAKRRCCAIGECCHATFSARSRADARDTLRTAYTCAVEDELLSRNPVAVIRLPAPRTRKRRWWTVDDARRFLESARSAGEPLYAVQRWNRETSAAASIAALLKPRCPGLPCTVPGRRAGPCWPPWMCIRALRCRSCDTARSPSRWRSTPSSPRPPPATRSRNSASGWAARHVAVLQCCTGIKTASHMIATGR
jgi:FtsK/SpoIIIE family/Phage integrase, N-terminal SAM-like domain